MSGWTCPDCGSENGEVMTVIECPRGSTKHRF